MEIQQVQRKKSEERKVRINMRISAEQSEFMALHKISPTMLFNVALKELMQKNQNGKTKDNVQ